MPTYTFFDKNTGKEYDDIMTWTELDNFLEKNPHIERVYKMNIVDSVSIGGDTPPSRFFKICSGESCDRPWS